LICFPDQAISLLGSLSLLGNPTGASLGILLTHPAPKSIIHIPVKLGEEFIGVGTIAVEIPPTPKDGIQVFELTGKR